MENSGFLFLPFVCPPPPPPFFILWFFWRLRNETVARLRGVAPGDDNYPRHVENSSDCIDASLQKNKQTWLLCFSLPGEKRFNRVHARRHTTYLTPEEHFAYFRSENRFSLPFFQENVTIESESGLDANG